MMVGKTAHRAQKITALDVWGRRIEIAIWPDLTQECQRGTLSPLVPRCGIVTANAPNGSRVMYHVRLDSIEAAEKETKA